MKEPKTGRRHYLDKGLVAVETFLPRTINNLYERKRKQVAKTQGRKFSRNDFFRWHLIKTAPKG